ncbi:hypothetical protein SUGI_0428120 [Cryptomeria japonica]|nr:protein DETOXIFICATION 33 isoform X2 [Cryptomeria japonica]GLJ22722.1 hypothetical protein SUGI_0428120 [Cryptomeria japonica]
MEADSIKSSLLETKQEPSVEDCHRNSSHHSLINEIWLESKKLWLIAGPVIFTSICFYSMGAVTQAFAGHLGNIELAAVTINDAVIGGLAMGIMVGMGSALETLCGQAVGTGDIQMLSVYMQRSWIISIATAIVLTPLYIFAGLILKAFGQSEDISQVTQKFCIWMLPQLLAFAIYFPVQKFLQAQSKVMAMAWISVIGLILHIFLCWICIVKLGWGLAGAAVSLNISWWMITLGQLIYVACGPCSDAWRGLSMLAFKGLGAFVKLSMASAVMLCLESWYFTVLIVLTGNLKNPTVAIDSMSICMTVLGWQIMIPMGFNAAISVRVSNELGAGCPKAAKFSTVVVSFTSMVIGILSIGVIYITKDYFALLFTDSQEVIKASSKFSTLLALTILLYSLQIVLSGVAVGSGWQALVAYVNIGCYYIVGMPLGFVFGYKLNLEGQGIWTGMLLGVVMQTLILTIITYRTDWIKEASQAEDRIRIWGGSGGHGKQKE